MRVLDLFSGTGSATQPFADRGHEVYRIDMDEKFDADMHADILALDAGDIPLGFGPELVWASPPCTSYSMGSVRHHWLALAPCVCGNKVRRVTGERWECVDRCDTPKPDGPLTYHPKSEVAQQGQALLRATLDLIHELNPRWWIIENPRALMRKMPDLEGVERRTITHCQYGDPRRMKPTDLFGVFPDGFIARACKNGAPCHEPAPRGAKTGTQGLSKTEAGMLPYDLGLELCEAMEQKLAHAS